MRAWLGWIAATLAIAVVVHLASVALLPRFIMTRTMLGIASGTSGVNRMGFAKRPTAASHGVVRPSPDLLYSSCVFDLKDGPVRVRAHGMPKTYWSVSLFDAETNNFFVENDRKAGDGVDFVIAPSAFNAPDGVPVVVSPSKRGLILFRTLIDDDTRLAAIDKARRGASCAVYIPEPH